MKHADIIVPFMQYNDEAVDMLVQTLKIRMSIMDQEKQDGDYEPITPVSMAVQKELGKRKPLNNSDVFVKYQPPEAKQIKLHGLIVLTKALLAENSDMRNYQVKTNLKELSYQLIKLFSRENQNARSLLSREVPD